MKVFELEEKENELCKTCGHLKDVNKILATKMGFPLLKTSKECELQQCNYKEIKK